MTKSTKKPAKKKRTPRKDQSQIALSVVEKAIGGKLSDGMNLPKPKRPRR
jgi:hypothetical protein